MRDVRKIKNRYSIELNEKQVIFVFVSFVVFILIAFVIGIQLGKRSASIDSFQLKVEETEK